MNPEFSLPSDMQTAMIICGVILIGCIGAWIYIQSRKGT